jgi:hypothetical protein
MTPFMEGVLTGLAIMGLIWVMAAKIWRRLG